MSKALDDFLALRRPEAGADRVGSPAGVTVPFDRMATEVRAVRDGTWARAAPTSWRTWAGCWTTWSPRSRDPPSGGAEQAEFVDTLQVTASEEEAHELAQRHLQRSLPGSAVVVLKRNNSGPSPGRTTTP